MITPTLDPYASRTDRDAGIVQRVEPVIHGGGSYADALNLGQLEC